MIYYEDDNNNKLKLRIENFINYRENIKNFVNKNTIFIKFKYVVMKWYYLKINKLEITKW